MTSEAGHQRRDLGLQAVSLEAWAAQLEVLLDLRALGSAENLAVEEEIGPLEGLPADFLHLGPGSMCSPGLDVLNCPAAHDRRARPSRSLVRALVPSTSFAGPFFPDAG